MNNFYVNVGTEIDKKIPASLRKYTDFLGDKLTNKIVLNDCSNAEVESLIAKMSTSKASGPFSVPSKVLKEFDAFFVPLLTSIINKSFKEGVFPSNLKCAKVIPIYKKGDKTKCPNYRPISLLSNVSKIFERVMSNRLENYLNSNSILYEHQYGFRKKYSTEHAILSITEKIKTNLDRNIFACGVFVDLEKAFDTVNHKILLAKLDHLGINCSSNKWLTSYLSNRSQCVTVNGVNSEYLPINCGVPQGSILGPLLFSIYINDMNKAFSHSTVYHFADDTNLLYSNKNPKIIKKKMNQDLKFLFDWLCANRLSLNVAKTEFIIFRPPKMSLNDRIVLTLNRTKIFESRKLKYLGLIIDDRLSWKFHIVELTKKLNRSVGMLYKIRNYTPTHVLTSLYYSLFNSHMSYGLSAWGFARKDLIEKITLLQKKAVRAITFADFRANSGPILKKLGILTPADLFYFKICSLMWDFDNGIMPPSLAANFARKHSVHSYQTRAASSGKLHIESTNTKTHGSNSFKILGAKTLNELKNLSMFRDALTKKSFLNRFKRSLLEKY